MLDVRVMIGRLTRDPDCRVIGEDIDVASFTLACDGDYKDSEGNKKTEFVDCKAWRKNAKFVEEYIGKGRLVCVVGRTLTEEWEDEKFHNDEGEPLKRKKSVLQVDKVYPIDSKRDNSSDDEGSSSSYGKTARSDKGTKRPPKW